MATTHPTVQSQHSSGKVPTPRERPARGAAGGAAGGGPPLRALLHGPGCGPVRHRRVGDARRRHHQRARRGDLRAARRRGPQDLVADRHQRRRLQVLPRPPRLAAARAQRAPADRPRRRHHRLLGARERLLRHRRRRRRLPRRAHPRAALPDGLLQLAGLVQRRHRAQAAVLGLLHQLGRGHHGLDPAPGQHRGHALQVRLGHRQQPLDPALRRASRWPAAAPPRGRSPSCAASTPSPASSRAAARPAAPRRW